VSAAAEPSDVRLDYAPGEQVRRRKLVRRVVFAVLALIVISLGVAFGPAGYRWVRMQSIVRAAANHTFPANFDVYEDDPSPNGIPPGPNTQRGLGTLRPTTALHPDPVELADLLSVTDGGSGFSMFAGTGWQGAPLFFLGERTAPGGKRWLVAARLTGVTYYPHDGGTLATGYRYLIIERDGWRRPKRHSLGQAWGGVHIPTSEESGRGVEGVLKKDPAAPKEPGRIRVFAGRADPNDGAAFTVPYEVNGRTKQFRFRVTDEGDLKLEEQGKEISLPPTPSRQQ